MSILIIFINVLFHQSIERKVKKRKKRVLPEIFFLSPERVFLIMGEGSVVEANRPSRSASNSKKNPISNSYKKIEKIMEEMESIWLSW